MIDIVNYGLGNLDSVLRAFERLSIPARIIATPEEVRASEKLILPGVGHAAWGMEKLRETGLIDALNKKVLEEKTPILGICLGMQLMTKRSEEGDTECLGWFDVETVRFPYDGSEKSHDVSPLERRIPHMGWNNITPKRDHPLLAGVTPQSSFYFAHSYYVKVENSEDLLGSTSYQIKFATVIGKGNIYGAQFHPEKSHEDGLILLKNFAQL